MLSFSEYLTEVVTNKKTLKTNSFADFPNIGPGTIFVAEWSDERYKYDTFTDVKYWQVVKRVGKTVHVRPIKFNRNGGSRGLATPVKDSFIGSNISQYTLNGNPKDTTNKSVYLNIDGNEAKVWDGKPTYYDIS